MCLVLWNTTERISSLYHINIRKIKTELVYDLHVSIKTNSAELKNDKEHFILIDATWYQNKEAKSYLAV